MARSRSNEGPGAELFRRLREFQLRVGPPPTLRVNDSVGSARVPLSGNQAAVVARLRDQSPQLADSLEQALADLHDATRLTYVGPAGEAREVMRAAIQLF